MKNGNNVSTVVYYFDDQTVGIQVDELAHVPRCGEGVYFEKFGRFRVRDVIQHIPEFALKETYLENSSHKTTTLTHIPSDCSKYVTYLIFLDRVDYFGYAGESLLDT